MKKIHVALLSVVAVGFAVVVFAVAVSVPRGVHAATVTFDAVGPAGGAGASCTSCKTLSWSHFVGVSGTNRLVVVGVSVGGPNSGTTQTATATYGGAAMTFVASTSNDSSKDGKAFLFYLVNPPTGTSTVAVGLTGNTPGSVIAGSLSFTGVNQTTPIQNAKSAAGRSATASVNVTSAAGDMVVDVVSYGTNGTTKSGTGETQRWLKDLNSNTGGSNGAESTAPGASSVTMSYSIPSDEWGIIGMDIVAGSSSTSTPPVISAVTSTNVTNSSATITWTTNETATSQVAYGTSTAYSASTTVNGTLVTAHSVALSGLSSSTLYHYQVLSTDANGNKATSTDATFTTTAGPDTIAPSVPTNLVATPVSYSQINLTWATSTDNVGVAGYQVFQNGSQIATTTLANYSNTGLTASTTYTYNVTAFDAAGNISAQSSSTSATTPLAPDTTPPVVAMTAPSPSSTVSGTSTVISATATDPVVNGQVTSGVASVQFRLDGAPLGAAVTSSPYSIVWDTTTATNGGHTLSAIATDVAGNATTSAPVTVVVSNVDTIPPSVPTSVTATAISSSQINLTWASSTDNVGVAGYQVFRNGLQIASSTITSYSDTGLTASTTYTYNIAAFDNAGNVSAPSSPASATTLSVSTSSVPTLVQTVGLMSNESDDPGNHFQVVLPNPVLAGNFVGVALTYASGTVPTITDNKGTNTWVDAVNCSYNSGWMAQKYSLIYSLNTAPGTQTLTVNFPANVLNVNVHVVEFTNIATSGAVDGTPVCATGVTGPNVDAGAITTTQNGDLIWNYIVDESNGIFGQGNNQPITSINFGGNFTGLYADQGLGTAAQFAVQPTHGVIHATSTWAQGSHDPFASVAIAFKSAPAGTAPAPGIRIIREEAFSPQSASAPFTLPCSGNLLVALTGEGSYNEDNLGSITSVPANTWNKINPSVDSPYLFHADNATCSSGLHGTVNITGSVDYDYMVFFDITGAATAPLDTAATCPSPSTTGGAGTGSCINNGEQTAPNQDIVNAPNITPSTAHGLVLSALNDGTGPATGSTNYTFDLVWYPGQTDTSWFSVGDGMSHVYNTDTTALNFGYHWSNGGQETNWNAMATAFKAAGQ